MTTMVMSPVKVRSSPLHPLLLLPSVSRTHGLPNECRLPHTPSLLCSGGWVAAYAHIVCAVIGSGVLSLAWSMSWLGELRTCSLYILLF